MARGRTTVRPRSVPGRSVEKEDGFLFDRPMVVSNNWARMGNGAKDGRRSSPSSLGTIWTIITSLGCFHSLPITDLSNGRRSVNSTPPAGFLTKLALIFFLSIFLLSPFVQASNVSQNPLVETSSFREESASRPDVTTSPDFFQPSRKRAHDPMWVHRLIFACLNGLLFLLGLANVLVLFIVSRYRRMRTVTNILIFNLCLADLIYISFLPVVIMFQLLRDWMFGIVACKLFYITESTAKYASVYFVGVLSLDRYFALCHPQLCKLYRRPNLALLVAAVGWCVTATLMTPIYLYSTVIGSEGERFCTVSWPNGGLAAGFPSGPPASTLDDDSCYWNETAAIGNYSNFRTVENDCHESTTNRTMSNETTGYFPRFQAPSTQFYFITLTFVFCFGLPALVILFFYFKVLDQLFQASNRAERLKKRREKTYRKVTRMVLAVISFYLICWLPYWIQFLVVTFATFSLNNALKIFFNSIHLLPYLNCAMNPILYSLMTDNFRRILGELFPLSRIFFSCRKKPTRTGATSGRAGQAVALLERSSRGVRGNNAKSVAPAVDREGRSNGGSTFLSLSASISPSIRLVSDLSINMLSVRKSKDQTGSTSATSISTM